MVAVVGRGGFNPASSISVPQNLNILAANTSLFATWQAPAQGTVTSYTVTPIINTVPGTAMTVTATGNTYEKAAFVQVCNLTDSCQVSIIANATGGIISPVLTSYTANNKPFDPLITRTAAGDRISGVLLGSCVRIPLDDGTGTLTYTDFTIPSTLTVDNTGTYPSGNVIGKSIPVLAGRNTGAKVNFVGCKFIAQNQAGWLNTPLLQGTQDATGFINEAFCEYDGSNGPGIGIDDLGNSAGSMYIGQQGCNIRTMHSYAHNFYTNAYRPMSPGNYFAHSCSAQTDVSYAGSHTGGWYPAPGSGITEQFCHARIGQGQTQCISFGSFDGGTSTSSNLVIDHCWLDGGAYSMYVGHAGSPVNIPPNNAQATNNVWRRAYQLSAPLTIPGGSFTVTVTRATETGTVPTNPSSGVLYIGCDDGTWAKITYTALSGSTFTGCTALTNIGKVATPSGSITGPQLQGTVRVHDSVYGDPYSGAWFRAGWVFNGHVNEFLVPTGTWVFTQPVWEDNGATITPGFS